MKTNNKRNKLKKCKGKGVTGKYFMNKTAKEKREEGMSETEVSKNKV